MRNEFTAIVEQDGPWFIAYCAEVPRLIPKLKPWRGRSTTTLFSYKVLAGEFRIILVIVLIYVALLLEEHLDIVGLS